MNKLHISLFLIFIFALVLRFIYFPHNVYFGFDQARDAYASQEIMSGNFKIIGPQTSFPGFHHGVLYYYIFGPIYYLFNGNPEAVSIFLRIINSLGVILVFIITKSLFNNKTGLIAAALFAVSYEQTQFSLFLNHPSLAVVSLLVFYLGWVLLIFKSKPWGLFLALFGLGLSIQFEFVELQLVFICLALMGIFRKYLPQFTLHNVFLYFLSLLVPLSTFVAAEIKYSLVSFKNLSLLLTNAQPEQGKLVTSSLSDYWLIAHRFVTDNVIFQPVLACIVGLLLIYLFLIHLKNRKINNQLAFLLIWFIGGFVIYLFTKNDAYFYNTGTSISLLIFVAFLLSKLINKNRWLFYAVFGIIIFSNVYLITTNNFLGPNSKINPQKGLVLTDEKKVIDFIYQNAAGQDFAVNALTMPLNINTTWSYLFEWYGDGKYGYLPIWGGDVASGYYGNLPINRARSQLPKRRYLILEPKEGIYQYIIDEFIKNENQFSKIIEKRHFGSIGVWVQEGI